MIFLIDGHPSLDRVTAETWADAEAKLAGVGSVIGELIEEVEAKAATYAGCTLTELKFSDDGADAMSFSGYGAVFNNVDSGGDKIMPGAFSETLADYKAGGRLPAMLYQHGKMGGGPVMPVGKWVSMVEDTYGLRVEGKLFDHSVGRDLYVALKGGGIGGMSIGYRVKDAAKGGYNDDARRVIKSAALVEVSLVNDPMNQAARFTAVKSAEEITTIRDLEHALRDAGYSRANAVRIAAQFQAKSAQGDPVERGEAALAEMIRRNIATLSR
jgi:HK97 family phage prohead protease